MIFRKIFSRALLSRFSVAHFNKKKANLARPWRMLRVDDVMVARNDITGIDISRPPADIINELCKNARTRQPVFDGNIDHIIGMVHIREIIYCLSKNAWTVEHFRKIAEKPYFILQGSSLEHHWLNFTVKNKP